MRPDIADKLASARWVTEQAAVGLTAILAAYAAYCTALPDRPRWLGLLPLPPLSLWLATLGAGCIASWLQFGAKGLSLSFDLVCLPGIVIVGAGPAAVLLMIIGRGMPLRPRTTLALCALAAAAFGDFGLRLFHDQDASLMVLVWQFGSVAAIAALGGISGRFVLGRLSVPRPPTAVAG